MTFKLVGHKMLSFWFGLLSLNSESEGFSKSEGKKINSFFCLYKCVLFEIKYVHCFKKLMWLFYIQIMFNNCVRKKCLAFVSCSGEESPEKS